MRLALQAYYGGQHGVDVMMLPSISRQMVQCSTVWQPLQRSLTMKTLICTLSSSTDHPLCCGLKAASTSGRSS